MNKNKHIEEIVDDVVEALNIHIPYVRDNKFTKTGEYLKQKLTTLLEQHNKKIIKDIKEIKRKTNIHNPEYNYDTDSNDYRNALDDIITTINNK